MKSKLMTLIWIGALAFSVSAPSAMAVIKGGGRAARVPNAISTSKTAAVKKASVKNANGSVTKISGRAAPPAHTILPGAKHNAL